MIVRRRLLRWDRLATAYPSHLVGNNLDGTAVGFALGSRSGLEVVIESFRAVGTVWLGARRSVIEEVEGRASRLGRSRLRRVRSRRWGAEFTPFVNELLRVESAAAGLDGGQLTTTYLINVGDRGVDAGLRRAVKTQYIPEGDSAWQFKAGFL